MIERCPPAPFMTSTNAQYIRPFPEYIGIEFGPQVPLCAAYSYWILLGATFLIKTHEFHFIHFLYFIH